MRRSTTFLRLLEQPSAALADPHQLRQATSASGWLLGADHPVRCDLAVGVRRLCEPHGSGFDAKGRQMVGKVHGVGQLVLLLGQLTVCEVRP